MPRARRPPRRSCPGRVARALSTTGCRRAGTVRCPARHSTLALALPDHDERGAGPIDLAPATRSSMANNSTAKAPTRGRLSDPNRGQLQTVAWDEDQASPAHDRVGRYRILQTE